MYLLKMKTLKNLKVPHDPTHGLHYILHIHVLTTVIKYDGTKLCIFCDTLKPFCISV